jgi:hypothetical protein
MVVLHETVFVYKAKYLPHLVSDGLAGARGNDHGMRYFRMHINNVRSPLAVDLEPQ